ncbi:MAG: PAS domain S-box protein, partial [Candidatus Hodarchaeota archaeon]
TLEGFNRTLQGEKIRISLRLSVSPGYEDCLSRVLLSINDITDRTWAETALKEREQLYRALFERTNDAVFILSLDLKHLEVNQRAADMLGYTVDELVGMKTSQVVAPKDYADSQRVAKTLERGEIVPVYERILLKKDGTEFPVEFNVAMVTDANGAPLHIQSVVRDISDRKKIEEDLRKSQTNLQTLFDTLEDFLFILDLKGFILHTNLVVQKRLGYSAEQLLGVNLLDLLPSDLQELGATIITAMVAGEAPFCPIPLETENGTLIPVETKVSRGIWSEKNVLFALSRDISDRKLIEDALRESENKYRTLVENSLQGLLIFQDERVVFVNSAITKITGYTKEELLSMSSEEILWIVHPEAQGNFLSHFQNFQTGKPLFPTYEFRGIRKDGKEFWVEAFSISIEYQGRPAIQSACIDITERKRAEDALRESEIKYRSLVENSLQGILIHQDGRIVFANPAVPEIFGYTMQELLNFEEMPSIIHPEDYEFFFSRVRDSSAGKPSPSRFEFRGFHKQGEICWIEAFVSLIQYQGRSALLVSIIDITERKRAEQKLNMYHEQLEELVDERTRDLIRANEQLQREIEERKQVETALRESEEQFILFMDHLPAAVFIKDEESRLIYINKYMETTFGKKNWLGADPYSRFYKAKA